MEAVYKINANQINDDFLQSLKKLFRGKEIVIRVSSAQDETEYLSSYKSNEKHILDNMAKEPVIRFKGDEFDKYVAENE